MDIVFTNVGLMATVEEDGHTAVVASLTAEEALELYDWMLLNYRQLYAKRERVRMQALRETDQALREQRGHLR